MTDSDPARNDLADRLLAEDQLAARTSPRGTPRSDTSSWLEIVLAHERRAEHRIRGAALWAWSILFALAPILTLGIFLFRGDISTKAAEGGRAIVLVTAPLALVVLLVALTTTFVWLFRGRSVSLAVIERRLAALEELLANRR